MFSEKRIEDHAGVMSGKWPRRGMTLCTALGLMLVGGCMRGPLRVRREIIGPWVLPSTQLDTPDPLRSQTRAGERLVVRWKLPHRPKSAALLVQVRLGDARVWRFHSPLHIHKGLWTHQWGRQKGVKSDVIVSYRVDLYMDEQSVATRVHPLWTEPVKLKNPGDDLAS